MERQNCEVHGVPYLKTQAMGIYVSLWDGSSWATQGGKYPINWAAAPFVASFHGFRVDGCEVIAQVPNSFKKNPFYVSKS
jgi:xyloglucan:xyloglucosyl transferase